MAQNDLVVVGIDVAKDKVDACIRSLSQRQTFPSTVEGRRKLIVWLRKHKVSKAVMEASGGYERDWAKALREANLEVRIVDPKRVRSFARSAGRPLYVILLLIMIPLAITELSTDSWISSLMEPEMHAVGLQAGWVLVYTAGVMTLLRLNAGVPARLLSPLAILACGAALASTGLLSLSHAAGLGVLLAATLYGLGKAYFWSTTLGIVGFVLALWSTTGAMTTYMTALNLAYERKDGRSFVDCLKAQNIVPGIKVDEGAKALAGFPGEKVTELFAAIAADSCRRRQLSRTSRMFESTFGSNLRAKCLWDARSIS